MKFSLAVLSSIVSFIIVQVPHVTAQVPQRTQILFASNRGGEFDIYVMNDDGTTPHNLTKQPGDNQDPSWSPDGKKIAFESKQDGNWEIYVMDADGKNQHNLTNNLATDQDPSWSPDGQKIAFTSDRDGNLEIYVMDADGKNQHNLTNNPANDTDPSWSPDGQKLAFVSNREAFGPLRITYAEVYVMDADGKNQHNLTNNPAFDLNPDWFKPSFAHSVYPAGKCIATWGRLKYINK